MPAQMLDEGLILAVCYSDENGLIRLNQEAWSGLGMHTSDARFDLLYSWLEILASWRMRAEIGRAAIAHHLVKYGWISDEEQEKLFGVEVSELAKGFSTFDIVLSDVGSNHSDEQAKSKRVDHLRRLFFLSYEKLELALLFLASQVAKMLEEGILNEADSDLKIAEAEAVYLPLTEMYGMWGLGREIGQLVLARLHPAVLKGIRSRREANAGEQRTLQDMISTRLNQELSITRIKGGCWVHESSDYGLYRQSRRGNQLSKLLRTVKIDVIVSTEDECNQVSRLIDRRFLSSDEWVTKANHFQDMINTPRFNGYRALIRKLDYRPFADELSSTPVEFRIRTTDMEKINAGGIIAAQFFSKERKVIKGAWWEDSETINYVRNHPSGDTTSEVYVFSPVGEVLRGFPHGSTPVDYAYTIHSEIGDHCKNFSINGRAARHDSILQNGDLVEAIVDPSFPGPKEDWLSFVKTSAARKHIARKLAQREELSSLAASRKGQKIIEELIARELRLYGLQEIPSETVERFLEKTAWYEYHYPTLKAMFIDIADPKRSSNSRVPSPNRIVSYLIASQLAPHIVSANGEELGIAQERIRFAECVHNQNPCRVVPGDKIVGRIIRPGTQFESLKVYRRGCENAPTDDRAIELEWRGAGRPEEAVRVIVEAIDNSKILLRILNCVYDLYDKRVYLHQLSANVTEDLFARIEMKITRHAGEHHVDAQDNCGLLQRLEESLDRLVREQVISRFSIEPLSPVEKVLLARRDKLPNPYTLLPVRDARLFKGREEELNRAVSDLHEGRSPIIVFGAQRVGKTSFLRYLAGHGLPEDKFIPVLVERCDFNVSAFWQKIAEEMNAAVKQLPNYRPAAPFNRSLLQEMRSNPFKAFQAGVEKMNGKLGGRRFVVMVDEFTAVDLDWPHEEAKLVISQIKTLVENCECVEFVLSLHEDVFRKPPGENVRFMPLMGESISVYLPDCLDRPSAERLILEPLGGLVEYDQHAVEEILNLTACHPYYIHSVLYEVIRTVAGDSDPRIGPDHVDQAIQKTLNAGENQFFHLNQRIDDSERLIVIGVASLSETYKRAVSVKEIQEFLHNSGRASKSFALELNRLCENGILNRRSDGRAYTYDLHIPLFGRWLTRDIKSLANNA